jgi:hypothetical protein
MMAPAHATITIVPSLSAAMPPTPKMRGMIGLFASDHVERGLLSLGLMLITCRGLVTAPSLGQELLTRQSRNQKG